METGLIDHIRLVRFFSRLKTWLGTKYQAAGNYADGALYTKSSGKAVIVGSVAEGYSGTASGENAHAEGDSNTASGICAHAEGSECLAAGSCAHAEGSMTQATGSYSHSEGEGTLGAGYGAHAEGYGALALGSYSHAEGHGNGALVKNGTYTKANDKISGSTDGVTAGMWITWKDPTTQATRVEKIVEIDDDNNIVLSSSTGTNGSIQAKIYSGVNAGGEYAHAEGDNCVAGGKASHAGGIQNIVLGEAATAIGKFAQNDNNNEFAFRVGNGSAANARHNAFAVGWDGSLNVWNGNTRVQVPPAKLAMMASMQAITQAAYDALVQAGTVDANTIYIIQ